MYCGVVVRTHAKAREHFQNCQNCQAIRREIRVATCKNLQHTAEMRRKYSEAAKKTSARPAIQQERAARLKQWRQQNPEHFQEIRNKAHSSPKRSKMENWLSAHLLSLGFERSGHLCCGDTLKQVDFLNTAARIAIEVDGPWHFLQSRTQQQFVTIQQRDRVLEREILQRSWRLIRLSMECFRSYTGELISPSLDQLQAIINDGDWVGIRCFGNLYEQISWDGIEVTILK